MSVRDAVTVLGTAVGAYFGYPQLGYAIGSAIGNAVDPQVIKGPSIGDIARQTSMEGVPRPIVYALSQPMAGNIIASGEPEIVRTRQRQGKGGPKVETESVYRTYAMGVCEGPIDRFVRVWRNNILVYDVSEDSILEPGDNTKFLRTARFFLGTYTQTASPDLEAEFNVGTTPSHRGTAYMVMAREDLTDLRGAIPQYVFQVERCEGTFLSSRPYPIEDISGLDAASFSARGNVIYPSIDGLDSPMLAFTGASLFGSVVEYEEYPADGVDSTYLEVLSATLYGSLESYEDYPPEGIDSSFEMLGGEFYGDLIAYDEYPPEGIDSTFESLGGTLS